MVEKKEEYSLEEDPSVVVNKLWQQNLKSFLEEKLPYLYVRRIRTRDGNYLSFCLRYWKGEEKYRVELLRKRRFSCGIKKYYLRNGYLYFVTHRFKLRRYPLNREARKVLKTLNLLK
jgi:hypothetical protein